MTSITVYDGNNTLDGDKIFVNYKNQYIIVDKNCNNNVRDDEI